MSRARILLAPSRRAATQLAAILRGLFPLDDRGDARDVLGCERNEMTGPRWYPGATELFSSCSLAMRAQALLRLLAYYCRRTLVLDGGHDLVSSTTTIPASIRWSLS